MAKKMKTLPPEGRAFISQVRYIITPEEKKQFLSTPAAEIDRFIDEFWKRRDPDPMTEDNEYQIEYYNRIEAANRLFREGGKGWLTERGRVYILIGPPDHRMTYPMGYSLYERPMEVWLYGNVPILFIDTLFTGVYTLEPLSAQHVALMNNMKTWVNPEVNVKSVQYLDDFNAVLGTDDAGNHAILLYIPYKLIALEKKSQDEGPDVYTTEIDLKLEITAEDNTVVQRKEDTITISILEDQVNDLPENHLTEIPIDFLENGRYTAHLVLRNRMDQKMEIAKEFDFRIK